MADLPLYVESGDTPGNPPQTPTARLGEAKANLELLLTGWERAVADADVSPGYRQIVADTTIRVRDALEKGTTAYNLITTVLAAAFLLLDEWEVSGITEATALELGFDLDAAKAEPRAYPSLFDAIATE